MRRLLSIAALLLCCGTAFAQGYQQQLPVPLPSNLGGTGVANAVGSKLTLGGALTTSGAFGTTLTTTGTTTLTLPTSGTVTALGNTVTGSGGTLVEQASPTFTGTVTAPTYAATGMARVLANNTSGQSIPNSATTVVTGWTTSFDAASNFVASTGVFTAPATAYYLVTGQLLFNGALTLGGNIQAIVNVAGSGIASGIYFSDSATVASNSVQVSVLVHANSGQSITLSAFQNSGGAIPLSTGFGISLSITQMP